MKRHPMLGRKMAEPGWIYILPECGAERDLIKLGRSVDPKGRADLFWRVIWPRPPDQYPSHFWAVAVENRQAAERAALQAMAPLRAFEEHPGWPVRPTEPRWPPTEWAPSPHRIREVDKTLAAIAPQWQNLPIQPTASAVRQRLLQIGDPWHPRKAHLYKQTPEYGDYQSRYSCYSKEHRLWQDETARIKLACFSEHFRCSQELAVQVVSRAIRAQLMEIPYGN